MEYPTLLVYLPTFIVLALALWSHRAIESILAGVVVGAIIVNPGNPLSIISEGSLKVMMDDTVAWVILVCTCMGSLIALLISTGVAEAFTQSSIRYIKSKKGALYVTWILGIFLFVDDYLNSLAAGAAMRQITDKYKTSREMLAYIVDSTAAPVSVLIPISTWGVFFAALLEENGLAAEGQGIWVYIQSIPYMFYAWAAFLLVPFVISGRFPLIGAMKAAEMRAASGQCVPPGFDNSAESRQLMGRKMDGKPRAWLFILPLLMLASSTMYFDLDFLRGVYFTLAVTIALMVFKKVLSLPEAINVCIEGFKMMIEPLTVLICAFLLKEINDQLGLAQQAIESLRPFVTAEYLPVLIFIVMAAVSFATGSNWGVFVIILPIVVSLGHGLDANMTIVIGATLSASTFGSHACFYSDATVLTAQASGCTPFQHAYSQLPYALVAATFAIIGYLII
ncbi:Na+/H+ antiporter NhaC family protein [Emcibacter sp.]|uniref:Na+/H+ antiporter NhaC family protein n=1 Tax=Emcibacter sp. TaxID=1979954 RepID=UPI002AA75AE1|nr:Na+/H+ antiporter NhaC family protein [Emcibacter sp.]